MGNVCVWREMLEFKGKFYLLVHKNTKEIVEKLANVPGNKHYFQP